MKGTAPGRHRYMEKTRQSRKREATHRALKHSAKLLFEEHGIDNVTIEQIAEGADVSRSTFFTHFDSLDDLLSQIADEEIDDIINVSRTDSGMDIDALFTQLTEDTCKYSYVMGQLLMKNLMYSRDSSISDVINLIAAEIGKGGFENLLGTFSGKDIASLFIGAYFGLIFQKFADKENFNDPAEINDKIREFIKIIRNQEETNQ